MKLLILPDLHIPYHDEATLELINRWSGTFRPFQLILLGDALDLQYISRFSTEKPAEQIGNLKQDLNTLSKLVHNFYADKVIYLQGNHEYRLEALGEKYPALGLSYKSLLPDTIDKWVECWSKGEIYSVGKANFIHGLRTGENHAKVHASLYNMNLFYGHTHDVSSYTMYRVKERHAAVAQSCGCLCKYDMDYMRGTPHKWQHAFVIMYVATSGHFQYTVVRVFDDGFLCPLTGKYWRKRREGREYKHARKSA